MPKIDVYTRRGCHLCEVAIEQLLELAGSRAEIVICDVDSRPDWQRDYGLLVPVIRHEGQTLCHYALDPEAVQAVLAERL